MDPDPIDQLHQRPLLTNGLLLFIPSLSYWYMRTHLVSFSARDQAHPTDNATLFFYLSFWLFPLVNLLFLLRALLYAKYRLAVVYMLLSVLSFLGAYWTWPGINIQKMGG